MYVTSMWQKGVHQAPFHVAKGGPPIWAHMGPVRGPYGPIHHGPAPGADLGPHGPKYGPLIVHYKIDSSSSYDFILLYRCLHYLIIILRIIIRPPKIGPGPYWKYEYS
jgi:hypothetical protein